MDWILSILVLLGNFLTGRKNKWGWVILMVNCIGWVYYALILTPPQYGLIPSAVINFFITGHAAWKWFREEMSDFIQYEHHGALVWVRQDLKGTHRDNCLCYACENFHPGEEGNCPIAETLYKFCVANDMVTPVFECPGFVETEPCR